MAGDTQSQPLPTSVWPSKVIPPPPTVFAITQILGFFEDLGYDKTVKALRKEATGKGLQLDSAEVKALQGPFKKSLGELYADALLQEEDDEESSDESDSGEEEGSNDDSESSEEESSDSSSESEAEEGTTAMAQVAALKRKRDDSSDSSSSESESDSDSDDDEAPPAKKNKTISGAEDTSEDSSDDEATSVSSSEVSSDSESSSESESDSDSSSDGEEVSTAPVVVKKSGTTKSKVSDDDSEASSATLVAEPAKADDNGGMHPARASRMTPGINTPLDKSKKNNVPFSRIPKDTFVDPRFASNAYVFYDYADRAHQDLIVTKGKGFTKEKNKKKRGSYRGGMIDTTPKGIKFDD
ncbi:hypothetical protein AMS68_002151 [Peltaster fructicola]|uniref:Srp40 C-terminal domain-containing protein n=1 Tax=Peltaster fructicola TaxID=286661 RepID=A0A6H0XPH8_9PEZI|nr:hypothetical protein AMS68_002151 [Peltaster fructicola]